MGRTSAAANKNTDVNGFAFKWPESCTGYPLTVRPIKNEQQNLWWCSGHHTQACCCEEEFNARLNWTLALCAPRLIATWLCIYRFSFYYFLFLFFEVYISMWNGKMHTFEPRSLKIISTSKIGPNCCKEKTRIINRDVKWYTKKV